MTEMKFFIVYDPDGYHINVEEIETWEGANERCNEMTRMGTKVIQIIYGYELKLKEITTVTKLELENPWKK